MILKQWLFAKAILTSCSLSWICRRLRFSRMCVSLCEWFPAYKRHVLPSASKVKQNNFWDRWTREVEGTGFLFEKPEATHLTQCHILEGIYPQQHCCESVKSCEMQSVLYDGGIRWTLGIIILASSEFRLSLYRFLYHHHVNSDSFALWKCTVNWWGFQITKWRVWLYF